MKSNVVDRDPMDNYSENNFSLSLSCAVLVGPVGSQSSLPQTRKATGEEKHMLKRLPSMARNSVMRLLNHNLHMIKDQDNADNVNLWHH